MGRGGGGGGGAISGVWKNVSDVFDNIIINNKVGCFLKTCFSTGFSVSRGCSDILC